ncbi:hypothetical protein HK096_010939 [Nowakowskiella sp. JEL0078]|nr:hypothetical protein HK096_010939 [Nowakowskiella sp. JEL0078]
MKERLLLLGDEITLSPNLTGNMPKGNLVSLGDIKKNAFVLAQGDVSRRSLDPLHGVFRIEPQFLWKAGKTLRDALEPDLDQDIFFTSNTDRSATMNGNFQDLILAAQTEAHLNKAEFSRLKSKPVLYGSIVQLANLHCGRYLSENGILPKFRIRAEGEAVRFDDLIMLQCVKNDGFVSVNSNFFHNSVLNVDTCLVSISSDSFGWTVRLYGSSRDSKATQDRRTIFAGQFVRIYHKEKEGYCSVSTQAGLPFDFQNNSNSKLLMEPSSLEIEPCKQLHNRHVKLLLYSLDPLNPCESNSANVFWQIEFQDNLVGGRVDWGRPCRFRHAASNAYLKVVTIQTEKDENELKKLNGDGDTYIVTLTCFSGVPNSNETDPTLFSIYPVNSDHSSVSSVGYSRIQHLMTKTWLGVSCLENQMYQISASSEQKVDDYFSVSIVENETISKFNFVQSMAPTLLEFILKQRNSSTSDFLSNGEFTISTFEENSLTKVITSLIYFCTTSVTLDPLKREGQPQIVNQTLLREIGIIDIVLVMLQVPFSKDVREIVRHQWENIWSSMADPSHDCVDPSYDIFHDGIESESIISIESLKGKRDSPVFKILRLIYRLLRQFLLGSNHLNQLHVATSFDTLSTISAHLCLHAGSADTLMQLISGNQLIVRAISDQQIRKFINLLHCDADRDSSYVGFLIALCRCQGQAVRRNQLFIAEILAEIENENESKIFFKTRTRGGEVEIQIRTQQNLIKNEKNVENTNQSSKKWVSLSTLFSPSSSAVPSRMASFLFLNESENNNSVESLTSTSELNLFRGDWENNSTNTYKMQMNDDQSNKTEGREEDAIFFEASLRLYQALTEGHNNHCVRILSHNLKIISVEECVVGLMDEGLPEIIRAAYCRLLKGFCYFFNLKNIFNTYIVMFVEKCSISPPLFPNTYTIDSLNQKNAESEILINWIDKENCMSEKTSSDCLLQFKNDKRTVTALTEWIIIYMKQNAQLKADDGPGNALMISVIKLVKSMYDYCYFYTSEKLNCLTQSLIAILDGRNDVRYFQNYF